MGKTSLCIQMLELLNTGRIYKVSELSEILETNSRNIIEYKKELEEAGYYITSVSGKYGGYKLDESYIFPSLKLSNKEKDVILDAYNYILSCNNYLNGIEFQKAFSKIASAINYEGNIKPLINASNFIPMETKKELLNKYILINEAIKEKKVIILNDNSTQIQFHPYDLFINDNVWYVIGWNQILCEITYYSIYKIDIIEKTKNKFNIHREYNINDYVDSYGFKNNKFINAKLVFSNEIKVEKIYGKNQMIEYDNNKTIISVDLEEAKSILELLFDNYDLLLSIEPVSLKDEVINKFNKIINI